MKTVQTKKGTTLPLTNLKGKDYLMVAYRILWFTEEVPNFHISTTFIVLDDVQTVAQVVVLVLNENGQVLRKATGTKRETKSDFSDHTEKAETGALGRALIQLGYGTQYALADLDEGNRIVDSPLPDTHSSGTVKTTTYNPPVPPTVVENSGVTAEGLKPAGKVSSFRKKTKTETPATETAPTEKTATAGKSDEWL